MKEPTVSVIMSVYNTKEIFLREAIESILCQTFEDFEFIIIDDHSDRTTSEILYSYQTDKRVKIITNSENKGLTKNLNSAIGVAKGKYLARMDADDIALPERFRHQVDYLNDHNEIAAVGTYYTILEDNKEYVRSREICSSEWIKARLFFCNAGLMHSSMMMRASVVNIDNGLLYDERIKKSQDFDLWVRMSRCYRITVIPKYLMKYRVSDLQISNANINEQTSYKEKILIRQLKELGIYFTKDDAQIHLNMCEGKAVKKIDSIYIWSRKLIKRNRVTNMFNTAAFEYYLSLFALRSAKRSCKQLSDYFILLYFCIKYSFMKAKSTLLS